jgi:hypothetical protein
MWGRIDPKNCYNAASGNRTYQEIDGKMYQNGDWVKGKEIRVFRDPNVSQRCVQPVIDGIRSAIDDVGLDLKVVNYDSHPSIRPMLEVSKVGNRIQTQSLNRMLFTEEYRQTGKQHADVVLTDVYFGDRPVGEWGNAFFTKGTVIMSLPPDRQPHLSYIGNIAKHEAIHLLGMNFHHDTFTVEGYKEPKDCVFNYQAGTRYLCDKDKDAVKYFWKALETDTGMSFFKR